MAFTCFAPFQELFGTGCLDKPDWLRIVLVASTVLVLVELEKAVVRRGLA